MKIRAIILDISRNSNWYIKYSVFFKNGDIDSKTISSKVSKKTRTRSWMENVFLPLWEEEMIKKLTLEAKQEFLFKNFADKYLATYMQERHDYQNVYYRTRRICKKFGERSIVDITKLEIKEYLQALTDARDNTSLLSRNSRSKYLTVFRAVFELAVDARILNRNFVYDIRINKRVKERFLNRNVEPFNKKEVNSLLEESKNEQYGEYMHPYLGIAFNMGMSASEILGLQVGDIDKDSLLVSISRNVTRGKVKETKTIYRDRELPIMQGAFVYFEMLIEKAVKKRSIWLFSNKDGLPLYDIKTIRGSREIRNIDSKTVTKYTSGWYLLLENLDIPYRDLKNCRHTFAVNGLESGNFTMQEMANFLGHGSLQMILKHYAKWVSNKAVSVNTAIKLY